MKLETIFEKFDVFADAPDELAKMRELVLQLAVQGRLVPQDSHDEPAQVLTAMISRDRVNFVRDRGISRQRDLDEVSEDERPFALPPGWIWSRLGMLCRAQAGFAFQSAAFVQADSGVPIIRI